ncbi:MAG: hypothetical protein IPP71_13585 [Bacteroidetes bacterium]|nr:hypothetical protein [Bacteroidota bacterium]
MNESENLSIIHGLQFGIVKQIDADPDLGYRVLVSITVLNNETAWARLGNLYATSGAGTFFYPEVGDEGFLGS